MARWTAVLQGWPHSYPQMFRPFLNVTKGVDVVPFSVLAKLRKQARLQDFNAHFIPWRTWWWLKAAWPFPCSLLTGWLAIRVRCGISFSSSLVSFLFRTSFIIDGDPGLLQFSCHLAHFALTHEDVLSCLVFPFLFFLQVRTKWGIENLA